jgi:hypothetical protein
MKKIIILCLLLLTLKSFCEEAPVANESLYNQEQITLETNKYFDQEYPGDAKEFIFHQGDKTLTPEQFTVLSQDDVLLRNQKYLKTTKIAGFTTAGIFGGLTIAFFIPSVIFIYLQTVYYKNQTNYTNLGYNSWIDYYKDKYVGYFIPGLTCIVLTAACTLFLIIDLIVTFVLLNKYKFNERLYQDAVDRYNEKLRQKYNIIPEMGLLSEKSFNLGLKINL